MNYGKNVQKINFGVGEIDFFIIRSILWVFKSVVEVSIFNYHGFRIQAIKDENLELSSVGSVKKLCLIEEKSLKMETVIRRFPNVNKIKIRHFRGVRRNCLRWTNNLKRIHIQH
jgi:hypothetical protein